MGIDYAKERERALARQTARKREGRIQLRARALLRETGWNASEPALRRAAERLGLDPLDAVVQRAVALQGDENERGRRIRPEEVTVGKPTLPMEKIEEIREHVRKRRAEDPSITPRVLHQETCKRFGVEISEGNFWVTYWRKAGDAPPSKNGKGAPKKAARSRKKARARSERPAAAAPLEPATAELPEGMIPGGLQIQELLEGQARVRLDLIMDRSQAWAVAQAVSGAIAGAAA